MRINQPIVGFFIGLLMPVIGFLVVYAVLGGGFGLATWVQNIFSYPKGLAKVLSLSILANILPFMLFTTKRLDYAARGVFIATMLYAVAIVLLKIFG